MPELRYLDVAPKRLPRKWRSCGAFGPEGWSYERTDGLQVICSIWFRDDKYWLHVSCARLAKLPSYKDLKEVKRVFVGEDKKAIMVFPPESEHVNIHPNCLHLYAPLGDDPLPDFSKEGSI
ncbi:hypothetical protein LCGC14_1551600 [marine sediment metagenome]|uniref:DUF7694 domain-containing protein n=1 Tax=marine sediment metagenome TaxID=412755 RepID=A0A0F9IQ39_9ZZZZ